MYDKEQMKSKVFDLLKDATHHEMKFSKQENFERAISLAIDEILEFESIYNRFITDASHLEVFQHSIKGPLETDVNNMISHLKYMVEKNYTKEEVNKMPEEVLKQVRATQEKRIHLLKNVARRYLFHPQSD